MASGLHIPNDPWLRQHELAMEMVHEISASIEERNLKYPSGGTQAARMTSLTRRKLSSLGNAIQNLRSMLANPKESGNITENERNRRRDLIRTLETRRDALSQSLGKDRSNKAALLSTGPSSGPAQETDVTARLDNQELLQHQNQVMRDQDEDLVHIEKAVYSTKHVAGAINEELTLQEHLITGLENEADTVHNRVSIANKHIKLVMETASEWKWWCLIFVLIVLLVIALAYAFDALFI